MFANYQELYHGYAQFYAAALSSYNKQEQDYEKVSSSLGSPGQVFDQNISDIEQQQQSSMRFKMEGGPDTSDLLDNKYSENNIANIEFYDNGRKIILGHFNSLSSGDLFLLATLIIAMYLAKQRLVQYMRESVSNLLTKQPPLSDIQLDVANH